MFTILKCLKLHVGKKVSVSVKDKKLEGGGYVFFTWTILTITNQLTLGKNLI